jgi:hypothetical protein
MSIHLFIRVCPQFSNKWTAFVKLNTNIVSLSAILPSGLFQFHTIEIPTSRVVAGSKE